MIGRLWGLMAGIVAAVLAGVTLFSSLYQGGLAILSFLSDRRRKPVEPLPGRPSVMVLIPAHNEERAIARCLEAVAGFARDDWHPRVVVVADNCDDNTTQVARDHGAEVLIRDERENHGKGEALAWAFAQSSLLDGIDTVFLLDADDRPDPDALDAALKQKARTSVDIVQVAHISRSEESMPESVIDWWATTLINRVRPRGLTFLGLPTRLQGGGMLFDITVLRDLGWPAGGISEDFFATLKFLDEGYRIGFTDDAVVWAQIAETDHARSQQRVRWESGRLLAYGEIPKLIRTAIARRSGSHLAIAAHLFVPPLTLHVTAVILGLIIGRRQRGLRIFLIGSAVGTAAYLLEGLRLMGRADLALKAVAASPGFMWWKVGIQKEAMRRFRLIGWEATSPRP